MTDDLTSHKLPFPAARARILGSGSAFPSCTIPGGERIASIETRWLLSHLAPGLPDERRAAMLEHFDEALGVHARSWAHWMTAPHTDSEEDSGTLGVAAARAA